MKPIFSQVLIGKKKTQNTILTERKKKASFSFSCIIFDYTPREQNSKFGHNFYYFYINTMLSSEIYVLTIKRNYT